MFDVGDQVDAGWTVFFVVPGGAVCFVVGCFFSSQPSTWSPRLGIFVTIMWLAIRTNVAAAGATGFRSVA